MDAGFSLSQIARDSISGSKPIPGRRSLVVWFLASFDLGSDLSLGYSRPDENGKPTATSITVADGSWAQVTLADDHGVHQVTEGGPRQVWRIIEGAHTLWTTLDQPSWDRFGLTVTKDDQQIWLDTPTSAYSWPLAPVQRQDRVTATVGSVESEA